MEKVNKTVVGIGLALGLVGGVILSQALSASDAAAANFTITIDSASVSKPRGDFQQLADAGFRFNVCYEARQTDGGRGLLLSDCVVCEPGGWNAAPATCQAQWKAANGGL